MAPTLPRQNHVARQVQQVHAVALSPTTKKAHKKARQAVLKEAAQDVIQLKSDGKTYGSLKKVLTQYKLYGITREQLKLAVKNITINEVDDSYLPAAVVLQGNHSSSPISILTGVSGADHHVTMLTTVAATTMTVPTMTTMMATTAIVNDNDNNNEDDDNGARNKGGRPMGTTNMARI
jgi:hypothetical protein